MAPGLPVEDMRLWRPTPGEPKLTDWWLALTRLSQEVRRERLAWPVHVDEFELIGRVDRSNRSPVWIYQHRGSLGCIHADVHGSPYRYVPTLGARAGGRFDPISLQDCIDRAELPAVVEPVRYGGPVRPASATRPGGSLGSPASTGREAVTTAAHPANRRPLRPRADRRWLHAVPSTEPA